ncbi:hypothetical protein GCM10008090_22030 [Arenicella chitinivorans]|uniref:PEGA domain-containing protein n=1 Tax=Arenicella chitinivorans TaxID=1329800 RepID=A0A918VP31_9GAMM|nr:SUMF1/EgtB/PvdO family nonheme iron enzyme [Arenicella chitinivorans]GHA11833.1 hypothetical protein GCM10008090_22030 [Arenicella chitinivorans]
MTKQPDLNKLKISPTAYQAPGAASREPRFRITVTHIALLAIAGFILAFIAFITLAKSIEIRAVSADLKDPQRMVWQPADVHIASWLKLPLGNRVLVLPGAYEVRIDADGFVPLSQSISVAGDRHQQMDIVIQRLPGNLEIHLPDALRADVFLDGELAATLPDLVRDIPAGTHEIRVDAPLYRAKTQRVLIRGKGETQIMSVKLEPAWAEYQFSSQPAGADIVIDGEVVGQTPMSVRLEEGSRELLIRAAKSKPFSDTLNVVARQDLVVPTVALEPADGELALQSKPAGAAVIVNEEYRGTTPLTLNLLPNDAHRVQVYKAGYKLADETLNLAPAESQSKEFSLQADLISVQFSIQPNDAQVIIDGQPRGRGSQTISLNSLPHRVQVTKPGYVTQSIEIVPTRQNRQIVSVNLLTEEQHYWAQIPNSYTNKLGHEMVLFRNLGEVQMGSSRRENGRRANEVVYTAELTKPFFVAKHETTNKQFRVFKKTHNAGNFKQKSLDAHRAPAVNISWQEAALYCNWLSQIEGLDPFYTTQSGFVAGMNKDANGYRLLTEVEWAWLARNIDDSVLVYPWGNSTMPASKVGNFADEQAAELLAFTLSDYDDGFRGPSPVGRFPPNHRGLFDMAGNVSEWVNDWYSAKGNTDVGKGVLRDPLGPEIGEFHVVRGASWAKGHLPQLRLAYRDYGAKGEHDVGFRVARYAGLNKQK